MNIRRTLWALPVISTIIFSIGLAVSAYFTTNALTSIKATADVDYPVLEKTGAMIADVQSIGEVLKSAIVEGEKKRLAQAGDQAAKVRGHIQHLSKVPGQEVLANRLAKEFEDYYVPARAATEWMMGMSSKDEKESMNKMETALKVLQSDLEKTNQLAQQQFAAGVARSESNVHSILNSTIVSALVVVLSLVVISQFVVRTVWSQLGGEPEYARKIAAAVASGDLSMPIEVSAQDSQSLLAAIKRMKETLEGMIRDIKNSAATIKTASAEISAGNADLAARTETQASSLEEIASAMEEMTETVKTNVGHAVNANKMSIAASDVAERGGDAVNQVIITMDDINKSAKKIADITSVIDGIAFQTNILALNAAVEAARAGEQGRGFAVVAAEVRSLAQRSASAAKEIKTLINESVSSVDAGTSIVHQAGTTMTEIVASIKEVADIMANITIASQEQSGGISEISRAIDKMDEMTQQNAAMVEQASAATMSLKEQADMLAKALSVFHLSHLTSGNPGSSYALRQATREHQIV